jgi:hypothetical protein
MTVCNGCGGLGVSLGDERFCARCLGTIRAQFDVGLALLYEYLDKVSSFQDWCRSHGVAA